MKKEQNMGQIIELNPGEKISDTETPPSVQSNENADELEALAAIIKQEENAIEAVKKARALRHQIEAIINPPVEIPSPQKIIKELSTELPKNLLEVLQALGVSAIPKHRPNRMTSNGSREITHFLYFPNQASDEPISAKRLEDVPEDRILFAENAKGYTTVTLTLDVKGEKVTIIGHSICSADDDYNGNVGVIIALRDAFDQILGRQIDHPIVALIHMISNIQDMTAMNFMTQ